MESGLSVSERTLNPHMESVVENQSATDKRIAYK